MASDDDLRSRFRALAAAESSSAPAFRARRRTPHHDRRAARWGRRIAVVAASAAGAVIALAIGLVWGTNTGYASGRLERQRQREAMTAVTTEVKDQLAALRVDLARARRDLARRARLEGGDMASWVAVESELRAMESSAERIEMGLAEYRSVPITLPALQLTGMPVKRALAITCNALGGPARPAQPGIPVVDLPPATVKTTETFGGILGLKQSSDGNVLVNDAARRQIKLLDTMLTTSTVVFDSTPGTSSSYGPFALPLIPYLGDSSLFGDRSTRTMMVLDGRGHPARTLALPRPGDFLSINSSASSTDAEGRLIYRAFRSFVRGTTFPLPPRSIMMLDSVPILRADLDFRRIDTIGRVSRPLMKVVTEPSSDGQTAALFTLDPLQPVDEWAVLSTGAVAFVRGHDYHVDWLQPGGSTTTSAKLPFDWQRLSDHDKQRLTDSVRAAQNGLLANGYPQAEYAIRYPCKESNLPPAGASGRGGGGGGGTPSTSTAAERDGCINIIQTSGIPSIGGVPARSMPPLPSLADIVRQGPISDYRPPMSASSTLADRDGNLWILPRTSSLSTAGELVYDFVNAEGKLVQRVRLPAGRAIAGFGKGGIVYLTTGNRTDGFILERTKLPPRPSSVRR